MDDEARPGYELWRPNRVKSEAKVTRVLVAIVLLISAALILIITLGGWKVLQGAQPVAFVVIIIYVVMAFYVSQWNRGLLPVAAAIAVLFAVIAAVSAPAWFDRAKDGFTDPALSPDILGLLTVILVPVQLLLLAFAMRGFSQKWNVEVEVSSDSPGGYQPPPDQTQPAGA